MAGEPILIVDDTPVNLKLTRILLVNEGYRVQTAASAEEALDLLRSYHPALVLADIQLPGMDGLEMTRRIKSDEHTRDVIVVALTAFAMKGDEQKALEAGCDGYITKPIDTRTLGDRIRGYLHVRGEGAAAAPVAQEKLADGELLELRQRFLGEGRLRSRELLIDLDGVFDAAGSARTVHQWIGSAGLLGYSAISRLSREAETLLLERPVDSAQLRETLTNLAVAFSTPQETADNRIPEPLLSALSGKTVALVGLPAGETDRLCVALEIAHARPVFFESNSDPRQAAQEMCDLAAIYVRPDALPSGWLSEETLGSGLPVLLVGNRDHLLALDARVQKRVRGLLMDSWQPAEALLRLKLALEEPARPWECPSASGGRGNNSVLVADDDAALRATLHSALESAGMECIEAADGAGALDAARNRLPDMAVLDVEMPGIDGCQVLSEMRRERSGVRVLLLAGAQHEADVLRGFHLGADDYLIKPFSPLELVARVRRLLMR